MHTDLDHAVLDHTDLDHTDLNHAIDAVTDALAALRTEPGSVEVRDAVDRANEAVDALAPNVTTEVLHRLVVSIADCHRNGVPNSPRLAVCRRSTLVALRLDPRWTRPTSSHRRPVSRPAH